MEEGVQEKLAGTEWEEMVVWPLQMTSSDKLDL